MAIRLACPSCRQPMAAPDHAAGKAARCPAYRRGRTIPDNGIVVAQIDHDREEEEEEEPRKGIGTLAIFRTIAWSFCGAAVLWSLMEFVNAWSIGPTSVQQAAVAGRAAVWMIAAYACARGFDCMSRDWQ